MNNVVVIEGEACLRNVIDGDAGIVFNDGKGGTIFHDRLRNRDLPDQHPISAITGLAEALSSKPSLSDLSIIYCGTSTEVI